MFDSFCSYCLIEVRDMRYEVHELIIFCQRKTSSEPDWLVYLAVLFFNVSSLIYYLHLNVHVRKRVRNHHLKSPVHQLTFHSSELWERLESVLISTNVLELRSISLIKEDSSRNPR